jgi:hypothetical protein
LSEKGDDEYRLSVAGAAVIVKELVPVTVTQLTAALFESRTE